MVASLMLNVNHPMDATIAKQKGGLRFNLSHVWERPIKLIPGRLSHDQSSGSVAVAIQTERVFQYYFVEKQFKGTAIGLMVSWSHMDSYSDSQRLI